MVWRRGYFDTMGYRFSIQYDNPDFKEYLMRWDNGFSRRTGPTDKALTIAWAVNDGAEELYEMPTADLLN